MRKRGAEVCESGAQHMHGARGVQHEVAVTERQRLKRRQRLQQCRAEEKWGSQTGAVALKNKEGSVGTVELFVARRGNACHGGPGAKHGCRDPQRSCS